MIKRSLPLYISFLLIAVLSNAQDAYKSVSRYDYYTNEAEAEIAVWIPASKAELSITIDIDFDSEGLLNDASAMAGQFMILGFDLETFNPGNNEVTVSYYENGKPAGSDKVHVLLLEDHYNAVKIDRVSGGLIVEDLPFYPFGFYNYSPVQPGLAEEEVVKGFNLMSPYQKIEGKTLKERKAYMDRCAALGMKVNYNLLSVAGGGGVGSKNYGKLSYRKRMKLLRDEIEAFRDHPALLSWYISDEPVGQNVPPDSLVEAYRLIKELDPYHPVTVVFMSPWMAKDYSHVMDIVMADPYVIPKGKVSEVGAVTAQLSADFFLEKPVWIVPQAFGGNEWWEREPTKQELRAMTYLSLVNNAMGIQYFIRHGLNSFPKSTTAWNECGSMALEFAEITPYLFSPDPVKDIRCEEADVQLRGYHHDGAFLIVAVNTSRQPLQYSFTLEDIRYSGSATVMFEGRKLEVREGKVEDIIDAYGSRVYEIRYKMPVSKGTKLNSKNMIIDPSFEDLSGLGIPAACYARQGNDRGATYFVDSRTSARGTHSIRMTSPDNKGGMTLSFMRTRIAPRQSYTMSIRAKALPLKYREKVQPGFFKNLCGCGPDKEGYPEFMLSMGGNCQDHFIPDGEWKEFSFSCIPEVSMGQTMISPALQLMTKGTVWFDLLQMYPDMGMKSFVSRDNNNITVRITSTHKGAKIFYCLDGSEPTEESVMLKGNFRISASTLVKAAAFKDGKRVGYIEKYFVISYATGRYVEYKHKYSSKYDAGLKDGLVDGVMASADFKDGLWQGFEGDNLDVVINLKEAREISQIQINFLKNEAAWIFLPENVKVLWSQDGNEYMELNVETKHADDIPGDGRSLIRPYYFEIQDKIQARYIRIIANNIGVCPNGHPGEGGQTWIFTDEIIIQ